MNCVEYDVNAAIDITQDCESKPGYHEFGQYDSIYMNSNEYLRDFFLILIWQIKMY